MRSCWFIALMSIVVSATAESARADRIDQERTEADYVVTGKVNAVYVHESEGYKSYIVEIEVEAIDKGDGLKKGDVFRAYCYRRKPGKGGLEFDSAGHKSVPKEGQRIKAFVTNGRGSHEGVYPDWFDVIPKGTK